MSALPTGGYRYRTLTALQANGLRVLGNFASDPEIGKGVHEEGGTRVAIDATIPTPKLNPHPTTKLLNQAPVGPAVRPHRFYGPINGSVGQSKERDRPFATG